MEAFHVGEVDVSGGVSEREDTWAKAFLRQASSQRVAVTASWIVNWFLLVAKIVVFALSRSKAVLAALADSAVDLASQGVLAVAERHIKRHDARYPVGRARLEALGVLGCATLMSMAAVEVIQYSIIDLWDGTHGKRPTLELGPSMFIVLSIGTAMKALLWLLCRSASRLSATSDMLMALAEDHLNDVWSNAGAIVAGAIATGVHTVWWLDATAAVVISVLIIVRWVSVIGDQVKKVAGHTAPNEFVAIVNAIAVQHSPQLSVDVTRAYHFGSRFNVEMEIVLPGHMTVVESHDIALALQHKIEELEEVERAFVHVDYMQRDGLEHKVERQLLLASDAVSSTSHVTATTAQNLQQRGRSSVNMAP